MEDINLDILKTVANILLRKRSLELNSLEDDSELREIFEIVCGIETRIIFFTLLIGQEMLGHSYLNQHIIIL